MAEGRAVETLLLIFVFRMTSYTFIVEAVKPVFSVFTHDGGCRKAIEPKHSHFNGEVDVLSANSHFRLSVELLSLLANSRNGITICKKYRV